MLYWNGELRQIANRLVDRDKDGRPTFRLSEVLGPKSEISFAILSSYSNMASWLYDFFDESTPIILINQPDDGNAGLKELAPNLLMTKPFLRGGRGCMHIKVIYKDGRLRVAVPTANFADFDWRDIENTVWLQDIPMRRTAVRHDPKATDFPATLQRVLTSLNVPAALTKLLDGNYPNLPIEALSDLRMRWDWSNVKAKMVASLAGKHEGWDQVVRTGHPALMKAIQDIGARTPKNKELVLECQGSSIGTYSTQWMNEFYCSTKGESAKTWLDKPKSQRTKLPWPPVKILFPSTQTVKDSVLGIPGGGTMFCRKTQWEAKNFPKDLFHDSNSKRGRVLMHSKMIIGTFRDRLGGAGNARLPDSEDENSDSELEITNADMAGWAYVGSHNFTPSAWGTLSGSTVNPVLNIVNYEMGIVLPLKNHSEVDNVACWKRPARKYVLGKDRPWMQDEMREALTRS
ncbi:phospholipase D/nuclease [Phellopilus nigrolimitatus]|nr:phospholipase D/nuclease [Phellopilus nigrolimitatus]